MLMQWETQINPAEWALILKVKYNSNQETHDRNMKVTVEVVKAINIPSVFFFYWFYLFF